MPVKRLLLLAGSLLLALSVAGFAHAQLPHALLSGGGQLQIGGGLPLPVQTVPTTGGATMSPLTMGTVFPSLLIPPVLGATIMQSPGADPKRMTIPTNVLSRPAAPVGIGVFAQNPNLFEVRTTISFAWPGAGGATLSAGGRTGAPVQTFAGPGGGTITYTAGAAQFGGPAQFTTVAGAGSAGGLIPGSPVTVFAIAASPPPCVHPAFAGAGAGCVAALVPAVLPPLVAAGAPVGFTNSTLPVNPVPGVFVVAAPNTMGTITQTAPTGASMPGPTNMATSGGFPWTTGMLTVTAPAAGAAEVFMLTGMDTRVAGAGNISLVSGALSARTLSGPNGNRGWLSLTLPEPGAALGSVAALAMLVTCHGLARRRSR